MSAQAPFIVTPRLAAVAVAYTNTKLIADDVLPRILVAAENFKYYKYPAGEAFTVVETQVGRKGQPNQVEFTGAETSDSTIDQGLDDSVPHADIINAAAMEGMPDPVMRATQGLTNLVALRREVRAAALVFNPANYAGGNQATLSGTSQWSDFTNSDPVQAILSYLDSCIMRPNVAVFGRATWTKLSTHPKICLAVFGNNTSAGIVTRQQFAALFELDEVFVGEGWLNTAKRGQAVSLARVWGKHAAFLYRDKGVVDPMGSQVTFGFTAQWGPRVAGSFEDKDIGVRGGQRVRVFESVKELVTASDLGFFVQNAVG